MACSSSDRSGLDRGTREDRAGLFDYVFTKTLERESFSPVKAARLGLDIERAMHAYRAELIAADSDDELFHALAKISNGRRHRGSDR